MWTRCSQTVSCACIRHVKPRRCVGKLGSGVTGQPGLGHVGSDARETNGGKQGYILPDEFQCLLT